LSILPIYVLTGDKNNQYPLKETRVWSKVQENF